MPHSSTFLRLNISSQSMASERALELAESLPQVKLFRWRAYAVAINASKLNGSWLLEYYDPVVKQEMMNSGHIGNAAFGYGSVRVQVENNVAQVV
jgi:inner membrane protein